MLVCAFVPARVHDCTYTRSCVQLYWCVVRELYLLVRVTVLARAIYVRVLARVRDCTRSCILAPMRDCTRSVCTYMMYFGVG
jgi:hypothetical protein